MPFIIVCKRRFRAKKKDFLKVFLKKLFLLLLISQILSKKKILGFETLFLFVSKIFSFSLFFIVIVFWDFEQKKRFLGGQLLLFCWSPENPRDFQRNLRKKIFGGSFIVLKNLSFFLLFCFLRF